MDRSRLHTHLKKQHLLILEDFGLQPFDAKNSDALMEIIKDRHGTPSTIIKSQIPVGVWHDVNGEQTAADAMLDGLVCSDHQLECKGESLRKRAHVAHIEPSD